MDQPHRPQRLGEQASHVWCLNKTQEIWPLPSWSVGWRHHSFSPFYSLSTPLLASTSPQPPSLKRQSSLKSRKKIHNINSVLFLQCMLKSNQDNCWELVFTWTIVSRSRERSVATDSIGVGMSTQLRENQVNFSLSIFPPCILADFLNIFIQAFYSSSSRSSMPRSRLH